MLVEISEGKLVDEQLHTPQNKKNKTQRLPKNSLDTPKSSLAILMYSLDLFFPFKNNKGFTMKCFTSHNVTLIVKPFLLKFIYSFLCVLVMYSWVCEWKSENNFGELVLSSFMRTLGI